MRGFIAAVLLAGILRFILTVAGLPNSIVKFASMTVVLIIATIYFALATERHLDRLKAAYLIFLPYMFIELAALGYTWATGQQTIFHAQEYSFGMPMSYHFLGHLVGGLTWEPLAAFVVMEVIWLIAWPFRRNPKAASELPT